ncbi:uncharacterized protein IL334_005316 [Kwoniella shivajii]|uniref:HMG box domain-containing protein n=1 Tax=Kwoniella shivajii TaxID=564305 RepID=A0ABZ1D358_9TREE|nr:hypothetical protein IL334_005316 [Kwoniella shivajii]
MSAPSYEEMEVKRQEMIASFRQIASAMTRCVKVIEEYTALSPANLNKPDLSIFNNAILPNGQLVSELLKKERKKKDKKPRDPNAPKRPPSAYILFQNEIRDEVRNSNPGMSYKDILGVISQKWKDLTDEQKKVYEHAYSAAHSTFQIEEKAYANTKPPVNGAPVPAIGDALIDPALTAETDDSDDSDDSDTDDSPAPFKTLPTAPLPLQVNPTTLHAATAPPPVSAAAPAPTEKKKEKKRKNKEEESAVAAAIEPATDKKKKKKNKE